MSIRSACEGIRRGGFGGISEEAPVGALVGAPEPATDALLVKPYPTGALRSVNASDDAVPHAFFRALALTCTAGTV